MIYKLNFSTKQSADPLMNTTKMRVNGKLFTDTTGTHAPFVGDQLAWFLRSQFEDELKALSCVKSLKFESVKKKGGIYTDINEFVNAFKKSQENDYSDSFGGDFQTPVVEHGYELDVYLNIFKQMGYTTEVITNTPKTCKILVTKN